MHSFIPAKRKVSSFFGFQRGIDPTGSDEKVRASTYRWHYVVISLKEVNKVLSYSDGRKVSSSTSVITPP
jgi:hypothetical protein